MSAALDHAVRHQGIGASEIGAIIGVSPYATALDVYLRKLRLVGEAPENPAMEWGTRLEPVVADAYQEKTGTALTGTGRDTVFHPRYPWMFCTPDRITKDGSRLVEIKTSGSYKSPEWGEPGTDEVPEQFVAQTVWQMACTGIPVADIAVLLGGNDFRIYRVERDPELEAALIEEGRVFWHDHVLAEVPPEPTSTDSYERYLKARYPRERTGDMLRATDEAEALAEALREIRAAIEEAKAEDSRLVCELKAIIGDAAGLVGHFGEIIWRKSRDTAPVDYKALVESLALPAHVLDQFRTPRAGARPFVPKFRKE